MAVLLGGRGVPIEKKTKGAKEMTAIRLLDELTRCYRNIYSTVATTPNKAPYWAVQYPPAAPFVGKYYSDGDKKKSEQKHSKILIYGSAPNFARMDYKRKQEWNEAAEDKNMGRNLKKFIQRHRLQWEGKWLWEEGMSVKEGYKPHTDIGIGPFDNGGFLRAAALLYLWAGGDLSGLDNMKDLTERFSFSNISKYAIKPEQNKDTDNQGNVDVGNAEVMESLHYVLVDINVLKPDIILVAKPLGDAVIVPLIQAATTVGALVIGMYQYQYRNFSVCEKQIICENKFPFLQDVGLPDLSVVWEMLSFLTTVRPLKTPSTHSHFYYELLWLRYSQAKYWYDQMG